jgi:hypothetical protein
MRSGAGSVRCEGAGVVLFFVATVGVTVLSRVLIGVHSVQLCVSVFTSVVDTSGVVAR